MNAIIIVEKCFEEFADIIEKKDGYEKFYEQFGKFLKLAIDENSTNQTDITELVRFSKSKSGDELNRSKEHVDRVGGSSRVTGW